MKRDQVKERYKWKIEDIFTTDGDWEKCFAETEKSLKFSEYAGKLGNSDTLLDFFKRHDAFNIHFERLAVYAHMKKEEDASVSKYGAYYAKINALYSKYATELAFFEPEMAGMDEK